MRDGLIRCLEKFKDLQARCEGYRTKLILVIVALALLLDNMLLTSIVPIFPRFFYKLNNPNSTIPGDITTTTISATSAGGAAIWTATSQPPYLSRASLNQPPRGGGEVEEEDSARQQRPWRHRNREQSNEFRGGTGGEEEVYEDQQTSEVSRLLMERPPLDRPPSLFFNEGNPRPNNTCSCVCGGRPMAIAYWQLDNPANVGQQKELDPRDGKGPGTPPVEASAPNGRYHRYRDYAERGDDEESATAAAAREGRPGNNNITTTEAPRKLHSMDQEEMKRESKQLGVLYSAKAFVQLITNPFIGSLTHRIGYTIPMFAGFVIMFLSTIIFAFGNSYAVLFVARAMQGVGSSCSSVSGMGMLADTYPNDKERGNAMGLALGGLALGVLIGPPYGGIMSEYFSKTAPFLLLAFLALGDGLLQLLVLQPKVTPQERKAPTLKELSQDPYILVTAGAITFANMGIGMLEPSLPLWMMDTMGSSNLEQGEAFLPASIAYLIGTNLFGFLGNVIGRSLSSFVGLIIIGISLICIPSSTKFAHLIAPMAGLGFAIGMVDSSMMPTLAHLVDLRHVNIYGSVYAIGDAAFCLGFFIGPLLSSSLSHNIGFGTMLYGMAFINFLYAPLMYFLKNPPAKVVQEQTVGESDGGPKAYELPELQQ